MKVFLSAVEPSQNSHAVKKSGFDGSFCRLMVEKHGVELLWNLMSFYYTRKNERSEIDYIRDHSRLILIDSGAHSLQKGAAVKWNSYVDEYAEFIASFDRENVVGFFEMDVDNVLGYKKVLEYRSFLEEASDKIIPVWHKNRGIADFKKMCSDYEGKVVAITGFKNEDILDSQYINFWKYAHDAGCRMHCLGMTRKEILDKVPFDYVDSSSWVMSSIMGTYARNRKKQKRGPDGKADYMKLFMDNYLYYQDEFQRKYYQKWKRVNKDEF